MVAKRFEVHLVSLGTTQGHEIRNTRPCLIISPDEMNDHLATVIVAPMTTRTRNYPSRIACTFRRKCGQIVLDQIRTVDKSRLVRKLGRISRTTQRKVAAVLGEMFAP